MHVRVSRLTQRIALVVLLTMALEAVGGAVALAQPAASPATAPASEPWNDARAVLEGLAPEVWTAGAGAAPEDPARAALPDPAGDSAGLCLEDPAAGMRVSCADLNLSLSYTLGGAGPRLVLRYDSRPQPVPMVLAPELTSKAPIERWTIRIAGWTFEGEGTQPLALWDTTDKDTGEPVPAGLYDMEIQYASEAGTESAVQPVIVQRPEPGRTGAHWWHNYEVRLQVVDEERVLLYAGGSAMLFTGKQNTFNSASVRGHTLTRERDDTWRWLRSGADGAPVQGVTTLDAEGRAVRWEEPSGRFLSFSYDGQGRLSAVVDQAGRTTTLAYDGERISTVTDAAGETWALLHQGDDLVSIRDPLEAAWTLAYDESHRLTAKTDPLGYRTEYRYAPDGQLSEIIDAAGHRATFESVLNEVPYASEAVQSVAPVLGTTVVSYITASGRTTSRHQYSYDAHGRVVRLVRSPDGGATEYVWTRTWGRDEEEGLLLSETDAAGLTTVYTYQPGTALVQSRSAPPLPAVSNGYRQIDGYWTQTSWAAEGQAPLIWRYDPQGRRVSAEQGGLRWYYRYDDDAETYGQPSAMVWNWNGQGDPARSTQARLIRYSYDALGQLTSIENPSGGVTQVVYDEAGRLVGLTDALGRTRTMAYDAVGRIVSQTDALGGETQYTYDASGNLIVLTDAAGSAWSYTYDYAGRVTRFADPLGRSTTLVYGNEGELLARTDARGDTVRVNNDALGRPLTLTYPGGQTWRITYDGADRVTSLSGQGWTRVIQRDTAGRAVMVADIRDGRSSWVSYVYNGEGQVQEMLTSEGERTSYDYGDLGELKRIAGPLGETAYTYETARQLAPLRVDVRTGPLRTTLAYDALGRLTETRQYQQGARDGVGRTTRYSYDAVGNLTAVDTPEGTSTYAYDGLDRLVSYTGITGTETTYAYDAAGNRTSLTAGDAAPVLYRYDAAHQLLQAGDTVYAYDRNGRLISSAGPESLRRYSWDYSGRLVAVAESSPCAVPFPLSPDCGCDEELVSYRYALTGERLQTTRRGAAPQAERYDRGQSTATLSAAGQVVVARQPGASVNEWTIIAETAPEAGGRTVMRYVLADAQGTVTAALDDQGELVQQASFDPWGMPVGHVGESAPDAVVLPGYRGYAYEPLTRLYDLPARWYDPAVGRFISPAPPADPYSASALNPYVFGMNNPLRFEALDRHMAGLDPPIYAGRQAWQMVP